MNEEKSISGSLYLAIILSLVVIFITRMLFPSQEEATDIAIVENTVTSIADDTNVSPVAKDSLIKEEIIVALDTKEAITSDTRILVKNSAIDGSLRVKGARLDHLLLSKYKQTLEQDSPDVELLFPAKTQTPYYAEFGWTSLDKDIKLPNKDTLWTVKGKELTPETPLILEWRNGQNIKFVRQISIDENYMFSIKDTVENDSGDSITLYPYGLINKTIAPDSSLGGVVHEGAIGVLNSKLVEEKYSSVKDDKKQEYTTTGGWAGFTDRYWFTSIIFDNQKTNKVKFSNSAENTFQVDYIGEALKIGNNSIAENNVLFYAGAKEIKLIDKYAKSLNIQKFDLSIDFGWYYFLTKPFFYILDFLFRFIGNMGWAIIVFAALLRLLMFPVANKSYESMSKMKKVQPKIKDLQEKYKDDKMKLQQETMALYRKEKINPAAGCLPLFIQIPVFFSLYKVLNIAIEIRHAPFIGWIKDLSAPDPMTLSVMTHLPVPGLLNIGLWPIVMGFTMWFQQKLNPAPVNKDQARMFAMMPLIFTFMMGHFASGLVIYWTLSNILSIIQQRAIMKKNGV